MHRGVGIDASDVLVEPAAVASAPGPEPARRHSLETLAQAQVPMQSRRKRVREAEAEEEGEEMREETAQNLVKRLRKEIEERDNRIRVLEMVVQNLVNPHQQLQLQHQRNGC